MYPTNLGPSHPPAPASISASSAQPSSSSSPASLSCALSALSLSHSDAAASDSISSSTYLELHERRKSLFLKLKKAIEEGDSFDFTGINSDDLSYGPSPESLIRKATRQNRPRILSGLMNIWANDPFKYGALAELFAQPQWNNPLKIALDGQHPEIVSILATHCPLQELHNIYLVCFVEPSEYNQHFQLIIKGKLANRELLSQMQNPAREGAFVLKKIERGDSIDFANIHPETWPNPLCSKVMQAAIQAKNGETVDRLAALYKSRIPQELLSPNPLFLCRAPLIFAMSIDSPEMVAVLAKYYDLDSLKKIHYLHCARHNEDFIPSIEVQSTLSEQIRLKQQRLAFLIGLLPKK